MLKKLKSTLQQAGQMPLRELALLMGLDEPSTKQLLLFYIRKNQVEKLPDGTVCTHCTVCKPETIEIYRWIEPPKDSLTLSIKPPS